MPLRRFTWPLSWRHPWRQRYLRADRTTGAYSLLCAAPPIFYVRHWMDERLRLQSCFDPLFDALRSRRAYFLYSWRWWIEAPGHVAAAKRWEDEHRRRHPEHRFVHLCNTTRQWELFGEAGLEAVFCNQNCLADERVYRPLPGAGRRFDAVYDARLKAYKRHALAVEVRSLALLYAFDPEIDDPAEVHATRRRLAHAHFFNHETSAEYQPLGGEQINRCLNMCRVGLCLSRREGTMSASIQYLLSGLPIVSTASEGGRDVFFDDAVARIVEDDPRAVREAVAEWVRGDVSPQDIRAATLAKIEAHRRRLVDAVQGIYDREGVARRFAVEWDDLFFDKLFHERQSHAETLRRIRATDPG